jgi:NADH:ubiquinone oxidoreductase subunit 5 (subunit L)/multisubunit Na+/H+ antiporter MnhA subunit
LLATANNRISDVLVTVYVSVAMNATLTITGSVTHFMEITVISGCFMKSILILTYSWLPDAMEGPTPVSSLLHSATLVVAGIVTVCHRVPSGLSQDQVASVVMATGPLLLTLTAGHESDLKRSMAYSTSAMIAVLWSMLEAIESTYMLCTHAVYKACMFSIIGYIISTSVQQDVRSVRISTDLPAHTSGIIYLLAPASSIYYAQKHHISDSGYDNDSVCNTVMINIPFWLYSVASVLLLSAESSLTDATYVVSVLSASTCIAESNTGIRSCASEHVTSTCSAMHRSTLFLESCVLSIMVIIVSVCKNVGPTTFLAALTTVMTAAWFRSSSCVAALSMSSLQLLLTAEITVLLLLALLT